MINLVVDVVSVEFDMFVVKISYELVISFYFLNIPQLHHFFSTAPHCQGHC